MIARPSRGYRRADQCRRRRCSKELPGATPLELAAQQGGHSLVMATPIEASGADEDSRLENGLTSLCLAEVHGRLDAMKLQNCAFETLPLCAGARGGYSKVVQELTRQVGIRGCAC